MKPDGKIIDIPAAPSIEATIQLEKQKRSYREQFGATVMFKLFPEDPFVALIKGKWELRVTAPVGTDFTVGVDVMKYERKTA